MITLIFRYDNLEAVRGNSPSSPCRTGIRPFENCKISTPDEYRFRNILKVNLHSEKVAKFPSKGLK